MIDARTINVDLVTQQLWTKRNNSIRSQSTTINIYEHIRLKELYFYDILSPCYAFKISNSSR